MRSPCPGRTKTAVCGALLLGIMGSPAAAQESASDMKPSVNPVARDDPPVSIDIAGEARLRVESYANPQWADAPDDTFLWLRATAQVTAETGPARLVVQPIIAHAIGVAGGAGPVDRTGIDLLQAFAVWQLPLAGDTQISASGGRKLIALGSERLVGKRYGPNVPQPFDGVQLSITHRNARLQLIDARVVEIGPRDFDDSAAQGRRLQSVYLTFGAAQDLAFDAYWIGYRDSMAELAGTSGTERRHTFGVRMSGQQGRLSWNWETMVQRGRFAGRGIRAWSQATETAVSFPDAAMTPQLRLRANIASGDRASTRDRVETFNAMFPKGRYFGELTPLGPRNIINLNPGLQLKPARRVALELNAASFWRASRSDGIYDLSGRELRAGGTTRARHIGNLVEASIGVDSGNGLSLAASLGLFTAGRFTRESGNGRAIVMAGAEATLRF